MIRKDAHQLASPRPCETCGREFQPRVRDLDRGRGKHCSPACYHSGRRRSVESRFWPNVTKTESCWLWTGDAAPRGYGAFYIGKVDGRVVKPMAHRVAWSLLRGEIPDGLLVLHKCDVRRCVNPDHLFLGTQKENMQDASHKGRLQVPHKRRVSDEGLAEIMAAVTSGRGTVKALAEKHGISRSYIHLLRSGAFRPGVQRGAA